MPAEPNLSERVEQLRADQRQRWGEGERVRVDAYFEQYPRLLTDPDCALHLVYNEVLLREENHESPVLEEYVRRFPQFAAQLGPLFEVHRALESSRLLNSLAGANASAMTVDEHGGTPSESWPMVADYQILGVLGRGGMAVVYKARHVSLNRVVALKMILGGNHADPARLARFHAEAAAVARLQHPNIVQIHDVGAREGYPICRWSSWTAAAWRQNSKAFPSPLVRRPS
jgi:serine/threonine-protein kinase